MSIYRYYNNKYYIDFKSDLDEGTRDRDDYFEYRRVIKEGIMDFHPQDDPSLIKGNQYIGTIHELTHYYQDLSFPSCVGERLFKTWYYRSKADLFLGEKSCIDLEPEDIEMYHYIYKEPIRLQGYKSIIDGKMCFGDELSNFWPIKYLDLYESYAEMKAWESIIINSKLTEDNSQYIRDLLKNRYSPLAIGPKGEAYSTISYDTPLDYYSVARNYFLFFILCYFEVKKGKSIDDPGSIFDEYFSKIAMRMGFVPTKWFSEYNRKIFSSENHAENGMYLMCFEYTILRWVLFALEVAFSIPSIKQINRLIRNNCNVKEDFHPCCRFFTTIYTILENRNYFISIENHFRGRDIGMKWVEAFDCVALNNGWPTYLETISDLSKNNKLYHCGYVPAYQDRLMFLRLSDPILSKHTPIPEVFFNNNIPIVTRACDTYVVTFKNKYGNIKEFLIKDFCPPLLRYLQPETFYPIDYHYQKIADTGDYPAMEVFGNSISMNLFSLFYETNKPFKCQCHWCEHYNGCSINTAEDVFKIPQGCFLKTHMMIDRLNFIFKKDEIYKLK